MRFLGKRVPPGYDTVPLAIFWGLLAGVAVALERISAASSPRRPDALAAAARRRPGIKVRSASIRKSALLFMGDRHRRVFQFLDAAGVLHDPGLPGVALLVGAWLARESGPAAHESDRRAGRISSAVLFRFRCGWRSWPAFIFCRCRIVPLPASDLADLLKKNPQDYNFSLGHVLDLTPQALGAFRGPLLGASLGFFSERD